MADDPYPLRAIVFNPNPATVVAEALGLFAAQGLTVDMEITPNSTEQMRGLGAGQWDIASTSFDNVLAWSGREGSHFIAVASAMEDTWLPVYARPEVQGWEDLRGKPLAVDAVDTAYALVLRRILLEHGLDFDAGDYELVPVGNTGSRFAAMQRGDTYAGILNPPWDSRAEQEGMVRLAVHTEVLPDYSGAVFAVSQYWASAHPELLLAFLRGQQAALAWVHDPGNRDEAVRVVAERKGERPEDAAAGLGKLPRSIMLNRRGLATVLELRVQSGLTPPMGPELSVYLDDGFAREVLGAETLDS